MKVSRHTLAVVLASCSATVCAQTVSPLARVKVHVRPEAYELPMARPVWVSFSLENESQRSVTLTVPGTEPAIPAPESGLPVSHVFSGGTGPALTVTSSSGRRAAEVNGHHKSKQAPILMIAPRSSVGITLDLREYFPVLRGAGQFRIIWRPYAGAFGEQSVVINIGSLKRAEIVTDEGTMTVKFFYRDAPRHVANFIELAEDGFYNGKLFHRVEQGYFIQGGCPRGDGTGIRLDGKRLRAEFNGQPMQKGSVAMALLDDDPDSGSCQFFVCNTRQKDWDGRYTIFGQLVGDESFVTLDRLMKTAADESGKPLQPVYMRSVRIVDAPPEDAE